ncbi:MAG TPA: aldolase/citrate lyase family protein [Pirellulales bacterium]|nr:aldolase/citrate lyase family protein [Pirellulales bacterium]
MENAHFFRERLSGGKTLLGTCITFVDPTVTEALSRVLDFVWIDTEHNPLSLERVMGHLLATKGTQTTPLVRVPANDPVLIKPVLDIGAAGVIVPLVKNAEDVRLAVSACRYPPEGIRGFGPRRPSGFGAQGGPEFCQRANREIITIVQIEQAEALANLPEILATPGLTSIVVGPNDLAASLGYTGQSRHPEVLRAIDSVIAQAHKANIPMGIAVGDDPQVLVEWADKGVNWLAIAADYGLLLHAASYLAGQVREHQQRTR